jgi:hypothetical protein
MTMVNRIQIFSNQASIHRPFNSYANLSCFVTDPSSGIPSGPHELSIAEASSQCEYSLDEISFLGIWCVPSNVEKKPSVKITHITQCKEHEGTKLEETKESFEDIENEDIVIEEIKNKEPEKDEICQEVNESSKTSKVKKLYLKKSRLKNLKILKMNTGGLI